jgi:hypothetical protein
MIFFDQSNIPLPFLELNYFRFLLIIIFWAETYWLQKNNENLLVGTEKTGREVNAEKPERMFISCEENANQSHNLKVNNIFLCGHIP